MIVASLPPCCAPLLHLHSSSASSLYNHSITMHTLPILWSEMVLGAPCSTKDCALIDWMWESVAQATDELITEWGLTPSRELPLTDTLTRAWTSLHEKINGSDGRRVFSCWPKIMRESGQANCVGRTLLGARLFDLLEIPHFILIMPFHVVNLVPLPEGWLYVDLANGVFEKRRAKLYERERGKILSFDKPIDLFQVGLLSSSRSLVYLILCNLMGVKLVGENLESQAQCPDSLEREARIRVYSEYKHLLAESDLAGCLGELFPDEESLMADPLMEEEHERVRRLLKERFSGRDAPFST